MRLATHWIIYDPVTNPKNIAIGSNFTSHLNFGINNWAPYFDLKYRLAGRHEIPEFKAPEQLELKKEIVLPGSYSRYQTITDTLDLHYYTVGGLSTYFLWQHTEALKSGLGMDLNYLTGLTVDSMGYPGPQGWDNFIPGIG